ncbi:MAG TPA: STAS domain-containing protein [Baekduia sp.]|nr:STAS domain-containing protein [Baekduia sp.]
MLPAAACPTCPTLLVDIAGDASTCPSCGAPMVPGHGPDGDAAEHVAYELALGPRAAIVGLRGQLDLAAAPAVEAALARALAQEPHVVLVDLTAVEFADSTALSLLLGAARRLGSGRALITIAPPADARLVFRVAGLEDFLGMRDSRRAAMAALHRAAR